MKFLVCVYDHAVYSMPPVLLLGAWKSWGAEGKVHHLSSLGETKRTVLLIPRQIWSFSCPLASPSIFPPESEYGFRVLKRRAPGHGWAAGFGQFGVGSFPHHPLLTSCARLRGELAAAQKALGTGLGPWLHSPCLDELLGLVCLCFPLVFGWGREC